MKTYKDVVPVDLGDPEEREKLIKEVQGLLKQKGKKLDGYTKLSVARLQKVIDQLKGFPDVKSKQSQFDEYLAKAKANLK